MPRWLPSILERIRRHAAAGSVRFTLKSLRELAELEPELATVVDLKFFCGFNVAEIAALQGLSERSVQRRWEKARLLLYRSLGGNA